jgi:hypothetical protein
MVGREGSIPVGRVRTFLGEVSTVGVDAAVQYSQRNKKLQAMGYANYREYLASDLWRSIRSRIMTRDKGRCRICKAVAVDVHHLRYTWRVLNGQSDKHLLALCRSCHEMAEFRGDEKVSPSEARLRVLEALGKSPRKKPKPSPKKTKKGKKKGKKKPPPPPPANKKPTPPPPQVHRPISTAPLAIQVPMPATGKPLARLRNNSRTQ